MNHLDKLGEELVDSVQASVERYIIEATTHGIHPNVAGDTAASCVAGMLGSWCARPWRGLVESAVQLRQRKMSLYAGFRAGLGEG